jgi:protein TonB
MLRKYQSYNLKSTYPIFFEIGVICSLLLLIVLTRINFPAIKNNSSYIAQPEESALLLPPQIVETRVLNPPPVPTVPVEIPDDSPIEPPPIKITEYDRVSRMMIPPLPGELKIELNLEELKKFEQLPELIGGEDALRQAIEYPAAARNSGIQGLVIVEFTVTKNGRVENPVITQGIGGGCDKSVIKGIKLMRYKPGKKNGVPASFRIQETVQFILIDNSY